MPEYRHARSGSLNVANGGSHSQTNAMANPPRFDGPRSPPNTSHVPCKFFRQGACQAGNACPFSHDLSNAAENVCKYFAKGNCKFGPKCANIHILPDGRRINYGKNGVTIGNTSALAGRSNPTSANNNQSSTSALTTSLYRADVPSYTSAYPYDDQDQHALGRQPSLENGVPTIDMSYTGSNYGSPRDEESLRFGMGLSPVNNKGLSVLDAPLPASFDSNGISNAARFPAGPWPSSVPNQFGIESPTPSLSNAKDSRTSETLKLLHTSAFGSSEHLLAPLDRSPPNSNQANGEEYFGRRAMHSSRFTKPRMLSSSMPKTSVDRDWEPGFAFGDDDDNLPENYVPENLQDLLTPVEKARRGSMRADSEIDGLSKYGSPIGTSPSRWGPMFQRQKEEEETSRSFRGASAFGHVGSPLRNSVLAQEMGGTNGFVRPPSLRSGSDGMSMLSQQLQRSRLDDTAGNSSPLLHPSTARAGATASAISPISPIGKERERGGMERHVSSGSISSSMNGRFTTPINEDDEMFHMEGMEEDGEPSIKSPKRTSAGLANVWSSYAGAVAGKPSTNGTKGVPVSGR
ncbi:spindle poison sensitivity Scp3 [Fusarium beomiforme]|uniref:Spindle poison sensitivity Scp3 n=1 Tax=Fusarium beomiforme TaxID=44412 RepID=A0A9P5ARA9_9HYPO|nr:spindle poison sensitivity Scp3 [Fusarium beomiforme]